MNNIVPLIVILAVSLIFWIMLYSYLKSLNKKVPEYFKQIAEKYGLSLDESNKAGSMVYPVAKGVYTIVIKFGERVYKTKLVLNK